jgi:hypothetical protein
MGRGTASQVTTAMLLRAKWTKAMVLPQQPQQLYSNNYCSSQPHDNDNDNDVDFFFWSSSGFAVVVVVVWRMSRFEVVSLVGSRVGIVLREPSGHGT